jgi:hypothetical protein
MCGTGTVANAQHALPPVVEGWVDHFDQGPNIDQGDLVSWKVSVTITGPDLDAYRVTITVDRYAMQVKNFFGTEGQTFTYEGVVLLPHGSCHVISAVVEKWRPNLNNVTNPGENWDAVGEGFDEVYCPWPFPIFIWPWNLF